MEQTDLDAVMAIAAEVHPLFPEDREVMLERLLLYPSGCRILEGARGVDGYFISHPWYREEIPCLNTLLEAVPPLTDTYYLHDLAILPRARGEGHAGTISRAINHHAQLKGYTRQALVAVNHSEAFWRRQGFEWVNVPSLVDKLGSYEASARYMVRLSGAVQSPTQRSVP